MVTFAELGLEFQLPLIGFFGSSWVSIWLQIVSFSPGVACPCRPCFRRSASGTRRGPSPATPACGTCTPPRRTAAPWGRTPAGSPPRTACTARASRWTPPARPCRGCPASPRHRRSRTAWCRSPLSLGHSRWRNSSEKRLLDRVFQKHDFGILGYCILMGKSMVNMHIGLILIDKAIIINVFA